MIGAQYVHDHVMHFYHLHALDWVDVVSALKADPKATSTLAQSISPYARSSPGHFADVQSRVKKLVESGQLGIFANAYWGSSLYKLPPEANLMAVAHYLDALAWQRQIAQLLTIFGGKNPHPNFLVGGAPSAISVHSGEGTGSTAVNAVGLQQVAQIIAQMREFVDEVYVPDTLAIASFYKDWFKTGEGTGNFMTYGDFPGAGTRPQNLAGAARRDPRPRPVAHPRGHRPQRRGGHPGIRRAFLVRLPRRQGHRAASLSGRDPAELFGSSAALRESGYRGQLFLAQVAALEGSRHGGGTPGARAHAVRQRSRAHEELAHKALTQLDLPLEALFSTMGRTAARTLECKIFADAMPQWYDALMANIKAGDVRTFNETLWEPSTWPSHAQGVGFMEAPRGALGHWIVIDDGRITNYRPWCRAPGMQARAMRPASRVPTRRRSRVKACRTRSSRSRYCARFIASIPALPVPFTSSIRTARS